MKERERDTRKPIITTRRTRKSYVTNNVDQSDLKRLRVFCFRFSRAKAYINSKTEEGEKEVFLSCVESASSDFESSMGVAIVVVEKISSSV